MKAKRRSLLVVLAVVIVLVGLVAVVSRRHEQLYRVTVLPSLGTTYTLPTAINDHGQIVGLDDVAGTRHLFVWDRDSGMKDLGPMDFDNVDINNSGQIAGTLTDPNGNKQAFFWDPNNGKQMLGTIRGGESIAMGLNNHGQVVGYSYRDKARPQSFIWDRTNGMRSLTPEERQHGMARAINDAGHVIGDIGIETGYAPPNWMSCYWNSTDPPATLETSPDGYRGGTNINNNGYVLSKYPRSSRRRWVCLWHKNAEMKWLFRYEDYIRLIAFNDADQVLYYHPNKSRYARLQWKWSLLQRCLPSPSYPPLVYCLWDTKRGKVVLHDQVPPEIGKLLTCWDINNRGCIVGKIRLKDSRKQAVVLLEPIPERWDK